MKSIVVKFVADTRQFTTGANRVVKTIQNVKRNIKTAGGDFKKFENDVKSTTRSMNDLGKSSKGATKDIGNLGKKAKETSKPISGIKKELGNVANRIPGVSALQSIFPAITGTALATAGAIAGVGFAIGKAIAISSRMEDSVTAFKVLTGSVEEAKGIMAELNTFAARTPLALQDIADAGQTLISGGVAAEDLTSTLQKLGDVGTITGNRLGDMAAFVAKNMKTGILQGEDLNSLFDRKLGPVVEQMAIKMNTNVQGLKKLAGQGLVSFSVFEEALDTVTAKGGQFFGGMQEASLTLSGLMSTLMDNVRSVGLAFTGVLAPEGTLTFWTEIKSIVSDLLSGLQSFIETHASDLQSIGTTLGIIFRQLFIGIKLALTPLALGLSSALKVIGKIASVFNFVVEQIRRFTSFFISLWKDFFDLVNSTKDSTNGIVNAIRSVVNFVSNFVNKIKIIIFLIKELAIAVGKSIEQQFERIGNSIRGFFGLGDDEEINAKKTVEINPAAQNANNNAPVVSASGNTNNTTINNVTNNNTSSPVNNIQQTILVPTQTEAERQLDSLNLSGAVTP